MIVFYDFLQIKKIKILSFLTIFMKILDYFRYFKIPPFKDLTFLKPLLKRTDAIIVDAYPL